MKTIKKTLKKVRERLGKLAPAGSNRQGRFEQAPAYWALVPVRVQNGRFDK